MSDAIEITGAILISTGVALSMGVPIALIVAGLLMILYSIAARRTQGVTDDRSALSTREQTGSGSGR